VPNTDWADSSVGGSASISGGGFQFTVSASLLRRISRIVSLNGPFGAAVGSLFAGTRVDVVQIDGEGPSGLYLNGILTELVILGGIELARDEVNVRLIISEQEFQLRRPTPSNDSG
jgi:hypothetical protein